jgi:hypothetical protein
MSFGYGLICLFILPSTPSDFYFFNHQETVVAVWRIADNQTGVKHGKILRYQIKEALTDPKVFFIAGAALSLGIVNGAVQNFMTTLLKSFGYSNVKSVEYQMPAGRSLDILKNSCSSLTNTFGSRRLSADPNYRIWAP